MNKSLKILFIFLAQISAFACTPMESFSTEQNYSNPKGENVAKLKLITNIKTVYAIPNGTCIKVSEKVVNLRNIYPNQVKETNELKIKSIPLESLKKGFLLADDGFSATEHLLKAGEPITIFAKMNAHSIVTNFIDTIRRTDGSFSTYGITFVPQKGETYQIIFSERIDIDRIYYNAYLFDISNEMINKPQHSQKAKACEY